MVVGEGRFTIESGAEFSRPRYTTSTVIGLGAAHVDNCCTSSRGGKYVERYRIRDGIREGAGRAQLVNADADGPSTRDMLRRRTQEIDVPYRQWSRRRPDVDALRQLRDAITDYLEEALDRRSPGWPGHWPPGSGAAVACQL